MNWGGEKKANLVWPLLGGGAGSRWCPWTPAPYWACSEGRRTHTPRTGAADASPGTSRRTPAQPWPAARWLERESVKGNRSITLHHVTSRQVRDVCSLMENPRDVKSCQKVAPVYDHWPRYETGTEAWEDLWKETHTQQVSHSQQQQTVRKSCLSKTEIAEENSLMRRCCRRLQMKPSGSLLLLHYPTTESVTCLILLSGCFEIIRKTQQWKSLKQVAAGRKRYRNATADKIMCANKTSAFAGGNFFNKYFKKGANNLNVFVHIDNNNPTLIQCIRKKKAIIKRTWL